MTTTATAVDLKKTQKELYAPPSGRVVPVDVPPMTFLAVDGAGDPNTSPAYVEAVAALYAASYAAKFFSKRELGRDYVVLPLEGLWWADDLAAFAAGDRALWRWTMLVRQPDWLTERQLADACAAAVRKKLPAATALRVERYDEGRCLQTLHIGPFADEGPVIAALHEAIAAAGLRPSGHHHEIYLGDPRRTAPEKLRTVLRQPVAPAP